MVTIQASQQLLSWNRGTHQLPTFKVCIAVEQSAASLDVAVPLMLAAVAPAEFRCLPAAVQPAAAGLASEPSMQAAAAEAAAPALSGRGSACLPSPRGL